MTTDPRQMTHDELNREAATTVWGITPRHVRGLGEEGGKHAMMDSQDAELTRLRNELAAARETNTRLNKRAQSAEAALCDLKKVLDRMAANTEKGTPWVGGSLGRAFLAHFNSQLTADLLALRETVRVLGEECKASHEVLAEVKKQRDYEAANKLVAGGVVTGRMEAYCSLLVRCREAVNANPGARAAVEGDA